MIARCQRGDSGTNLTHHTSALVSHDGGKQSFRIRPRTGRSRLIDCASSLSRESEYAGEIAEQLKKN